MENNKEIHRQASLEWLWKLKIKGREDFKMILLFIDCYNDKHLSLIRTMLNCLNKGGDNFFIAYI